MTVPTVLTALSILRTLRPRKVDYPELRTEGGDWLPLHYMQHTRATPDGREWRDGHTICDDATGIPVARWSYGDQAFIPVLGFTLHGLPVYEEHPPTADIWTAPAPPPDYLGTPGSEGETLAHRGGNVLIPSSWAKVTYRRGDRLAAHLGAYGPLSDPSPGVSAPGVSAPDHAAPRSLLDRGVMLVSGLALLAIAAGWRRR